jgi:ATP adenylyltransferase
MEHLHAYWRMPYIEAPRADKPIGNPFAGMDTVKDERKALLVWRGNTTFLIMNKFPYNAGHLLAMPYREVADLEDLTGEESAELMATITRGKALLSAALKPDGYNIGFNLGKAGGAGIPRHIHCHIVPRWEGDTNFMPVIGDTRVLPLSLDAMWERLHTLAN